MNLQEIPTIATSDELIDRALRRASKVEESVRNADYRARLTAVRKIPVSYTHLTLPTNREV